MRQIFYGSSVSGQTSEKTQRPGKMPYSASIPEQIDWKNILFQPMMFVCLTAGFLMP